MLFHCIAWYCMYYTGLYSLYSAPANYRVVHLAIFNLLACKLFSLRILELASLFTIQEAKKRLKKIVNQMWKFPNGGVVSAA